MAVRDPRFTHQWTEADVTRVADLLGQGLSASQIAYAFGVTRNAVISIVHRNKDLSKVGFMPKEMRTADVISLPRATGQRIVPRRTVDPVTLPHRPNLRVVSNNTALMAQDWLDKHKPRRFGAGDRTDEFTIKRFLEERGYKYQGGWQGHSSITGNGVRKKMMKWAGVMAFVDEIRVREGLQPFKRQA